MEFGLVELSRLQFAVTALYHFLFVPLTIGLAIILGIMESVYVMTDDKIWRDMTQFWGKLFAINFAMGVATGITLEFQFGTNWAYYSHYVGDIFGAPLAIEGMMAFFLESTFVGLFLFGWKRLSKAGHLTATWLMALGSSLSALWILVANGWMQNPVGAKFNAETMRMEITSFREIFFNDVAQAKFVHTISASYVTGAMFVLAISCYYLLKNRHVQIAKRSIIIASSFGLLASLSVVVLGDESGYATAHNQKMKLAAIEGMWETREAPASLTLFAVPDQEKQSNKYEVEIPYALGIMATRSFNKEVPGIKDLVKVSEKRIRRGLRQYKVLKRLRSGKSRSAEFDRKYLSKYSNDIGYALLLKKYRPDIEHSTNSQIKKAALDTVPNVLPLFFAFRIMVALGIFFIFLFAAAFYYMNIRNDFNKKWLLRICFFSLPLPWVAAEIGWFVAEHGRQPWAIEGILPTFLGVSSVSTNSVLYSLIGFVIFYSTLLVVDIYLMMKYVKIGPEKLISTATTNKK
jgi:cytochrome d ubiquinol oxidase subunit I